MDLEHVGNAERQIQASNPDDDRKDGKEKTEAETHECICLGVVEYFKGLFHR